MDKAPMLEAQGMSTIKEGNFYKRWMIISQTSEEKQPKELQYTEQWIPTKQEKRYLWDCRENSTKHFEGNHQSKKRVKLDNIHETVEYTPQRRFEHNHTWLLYLGAVDLQ